MGQRDFEEMTISHGNWKTRARRRHSLLLSHVYPDPILVAGVRQMQIEHHEAQQQHVPMLHPQPTNCSSQANIFDNFGYSPQNHQHVHALQDYQYAHDPLTSNTSQHFQSTIASQHLQHAHTSQHLQSSQTKLVSYARGEVPHFPGVGIITLRYAPVNALTAQLLQELEVRIAQAFQDEQCHAIVLRSAIPGFFIAGADIGEMSHRRRDTLEALTHLRKTNALFMQIEAGPKPTVAAIRGITLGGGLELALSCNARVCSHESTLGLPELNLGIIPGYGGTQRLPRLIGVKKAMDMMLSSQSIKGKDALSIGLVDDSLESTNVLPRACEMAMEIALNKRTRIKSMSLRNRLDRISDQLILDKAEQEARKVPHLPHRLACVLAVKNGIRVSVVEALEAEHEQSMKVGGNSTSKALIHFFFASRATNKLPFSAKTQPNLVRHVAVLGGGTMGVGITATCLLSGLKTTIKEVNENFLNLAVQKVQSIVERRYRGNVEQVKQIMSRLKPTLTFAGFEQVDMVIEAVLEELSLKQNIMAELERVCSPMCILASNTNTLDLQVMGSKTKSQSRIVGVHFFSPAHQVPLLEIIRTQHSSPQALATCLRFARQLSKTAIVVGNSTGFLINRISFYFHDVVTYLVDCGIDPYRIDQVFQSFGMPMGPFRVHDLSDINIALMRKMSAVHADRIHGSRQTDLMQQANRLGEKTGLGYYKYLQGKATPDPQVYSVLDKCRLKETPQVAKMRQISDQDIIEMALLASVNEACRAVEEKVVYRVSDIDIGSILGMGFPRHFGGLIKWADLTFGAKKVQEKLVLFEAMSGLRLFAPCVFVRDCAHQGKSLHYPDAFIET